MLVGSDGDHLLSLSVLSVTILRALSPGPCHAACSRPGTYLSIGQAIACVYLVLLVTACDPGIGLSLVNDSDTPLTLRASFVSDPESTRFRDAAFRLDPGATYESGMI